MLNMNEAIQKIKKVGSSNVRSVPMPGHNVHTGQYQIEILESSTWTAIASGLPKSSAESIIQQATTPNNVLLG